jgi:hypothetical protein
VNILSSQATHGTGHIQKYRNIESNVIMASGLLIDTGVYWFSQYMGGEASLELSRKCDKLTALSF